MGLKTTLATIGVVFAMGACDAPKDHETKKDIEVISEKEIREVLSPKRNREEFHPVFRPYHCADIVTRDRIYDGLKALRLRRDIPPYQ